MLCWWHKWRSHCGSPTLSSRLLYCLLGQGIACGLTLGLCAGNVGSPAGCSFCSSSRGAVSGPQAKAVMMVVKHVGVMVEQDSWHARCILSVKDHAPPEAQMLCALPRGHRQALQQRCHAGMPSQVHLGSDCKKSRQGTPPEPVHQKLLQHAVWQISRSLAGDAAQLLGRTDELSAQSAVRLWVPDRGGP